MSTADLGIEKLRRIFHEVEDIGEPVVCPVRIEDGVWTPPSYIVRHLKVRITYEHFKVEYVCNEALPQSGVSLGEQLAAAAESMSRRGYNGCAAVAFYFSAVEVLLDVFYAFGNKDVDYETFKKGSEWDWKKRFKHVLPVSTCGELASIYERLLKIKRNIRDRVLHGMGGERKASSSLSPDWGSCRSHTSILTLWMGWDGFHSLMRRSPMCLQPLTSSIRGYPKTNRGLTRFSTRNPCWRFLCLVDAAMKSLRPCQNLISRIGYTLSKNTWTTC